MSSRRLDATNFDKRRRGGGWIDRNLACLNGANCGHGWVKEMNRQASYSCEIAIDIYVKLMTTLKKEERQLRRFFHPLPAFFSSYFFRVRDCEEKHRIRPTTAHLQLALPPSDPPSCRPLSIPAFLPSDPLAATAHRGSNPAPVPTCFRRRPNRHHRWAAPIPDLPSMATGYRAASTFGNPKP